MGKFDALKKLLNPKTIEAAEQILKQVDNADDAVKLVGPEREAYLKALDMVHGPKESRAANMGFDMTKPQYHGTTYTEKPIEKFKTSNAKSGQLYGEGVYSTSNPEYASTYADKLDSHSGVPLTEESGAVYQLVTRPGKTWDVVAGGFDPKIAAAFRKHIPKADLKTFDAIEDNYNLSQFVQSKLEPRQMSKALNENGYNSVLIDAETQNTFSPSRIRSTQATFDPRFKDSAKIMAGTAGAVLGSSMLAPEQSQAGTMSSFNGIKKMFQVGEKVFPASSMAEALQIKHALEQTGQVGMNRAIVALDEAMPVANDAAKVAQQTPLAQKAAAAIGTAGAMPTEDSTSPFQMMKEGLSKYRENIVDPIAAKLKSTLTPDINVQGQDFKTASPVSDMAIDIAADPVNYVPGPAGAIAGAAQMVGEMTPEKDQFSKTKKLFGR